MQSNEVVTGMKSQEKPCQPKGPDAHIWEKRKVEIQNQCGWGAAFSARELCTVHGDRAEEVKEITCPGMPI